MSLSLTVWALSLAMRVGAPRGAPAIAVRMAEQIPESAMEAIPPKQMADAWRRDERAKELEQTLRGCSLYLVGFSSAKLTAIGRILTRRLPRYRYYDLNDILASTYKAISKADEQPSLPQLYSAEPMDDVNQLGSAVMGQVQQYTRAVVSVWEGAVSQMDYAVMQQGIVVHLEADPEERPLASETIEAWRAGHAQADVTVKLEDDVPADDIVLDVVNALLDFIKANPAKSDEWKRKADESLEKGE